MESAPGPPPWPSGAVQVVQTRSNVDVGVDGGHGQEHIEQRQEDLGKCQWIFAIIQTDTTAW